jgi:hypothetical protein
LQNCLLRRVPVHQHRSSAFQLPGIRHDVDKCTAHLASVKTTPHSIHHACLCQLGCPPGIQPDDHLSWSAGVRPGIQPSSHFSWRCAPASNHHHNSSWPSLFSVWSACLCLSVMSVWSLSLLRPGMQSQHGQEDWRNQY